MSCRSWLRIHKKVRRKSREQHFARGAVCQSPAVSKGQKGRRAEGQKGRRAEGQKGKAKAKKAEKAEKAKKAKQKERQTQRGKQKKNGKTKNAKKAKGKGRGRGKDGGNTTAEIVQLRSKRIGRIYHE